MEQRRRLFFPGRRVCFVLSAFRLKRSLSLSLRLSALLGSRFRCRPLAAVSFAFVPVWIIAVCARSRPGRAARSAPPRRRYVRSSLLTITPHRDRTDKLRKHGTATRVSTRRTACPCGSAAHTTTRATLAPHDVPPPLVPSSNTSYTGHVRNKVWLPGNGAQMVFIGFV